MSKDLIKNNLTKMFKTNNSHTRNEVSRLGSVEQRNTTYRRNSILNFGGRQMIRLDMDASVYIIGVGGPPTCGS